MKALLHIFLCFLVATPALANTNHEEEVLKVARMSITMYGMYRIGNLAGAHGRDLSEKQICALAGQAFVGFGIMKASGLTDQEVKQQLSGLAQFGITVEVVQNQLQTDMETCIE